MTSNDNAASAWQPSGEFLELLASMTEAGMIGAVEEALRRYPEWAACLDGDDLDALDRITASLVRMKEIEGEHGNGAALKLDHPHVKKLAEWGSLGGRYENALKFSDLGLAE